VAARVLIESYERQQRRALAALADVLGRDQAAAAAGIEVRELRAALTRASDGRIGLDPTPAGRARVATP
jgi:hypothetical protein